jgi:DDE domain
MRAAWGAHTETDDDSPPGTAMCLAAAADNLAAGHDLLHTHFTTDRGAVALVDRRGRQTDLVTSSATSSGFAGFRFPREVISLAVRWYLRSGLSHRDVGELLAERGITVDHVTICRWVQRFTPEFIEAARPGRHAPGDRWCADETSIRAAGQWACLYRAIDQRGQVIDVFLWPHRRSSQMRGCFTSGIGVAQLRLASLVQGDWRSGLRSSHSGRH